MSVEYSNNVQKANIFASFRLIFGWKGSVYKLVWKEVIFYIIAFYAIRSTYFLLNFNQKAIFLYIVEYCQRFGSTIPIFLFLGFYIKDITSRFFRIFEGLPWSYNLALLVKGYLIDIDPKDIRSRLMRRNIMRYCNFSVTWTMSMISNSVKKRFPTWNHFINAGLITPKERILLESISTPYFKGFRVIQWAIALVRQARIENRINDNQASAELIRELIQLNSLNQRLMLYDFVQLPIIYTQAISLCVYLYFASCLFSRQNIERRTYGREFSFPLFTFLQFFFVIGLTKVGEELMNPFGEDDDDFDANHIIDINVLLSYMMVDSSYMEHPSLEPDVHWEIINVQIPYTLASKRNWYQKQKLPGRHGPKSARTRRDLETGTNLFTFTNDINTIYSKFENEPRPNALARSIAHNDAEEYLII